MEICTSCPSISEEDIRAALTELKTYVDVTEEDLMKIYILAVRHARMRRSTMIVVERVMTTNVVSATREMTVHEAAMLLSKHKISGMPVVDQNKKVIGVISEADILKPEGTKKEGRFRSILKNIVGRPAGRGEDCVGDVMKAPPITTEPDADIKEVAAVLDLHRIKRLPVTDPEGKLVGIVSRGDIIRAMGKK